MAGKENTSPHSSGERMCFHHSLAVSALWVGLFNWPHWNLDRIIGIIVKLLMKILHMPAKVTYFICLSWQLACVFNKRAASFILSLCGLVRCKLHSSELTKGFDGVCDWLALEHLLQSIIGTYQGFFFSVLLSIVSSHKSTCFRIRSVGLQSSSLFPFVSFFARH